jgi:surface protein
MSKKIEILSNSVVITDTITGIEELDKAKSYVYYDIKSLNAGRISLNFKSGNISGVTEVFSCNLADAVDTELVAFTIESFKSFARLNLGFKTASGGSGAEEGGGEAVWSQADYQEIYDSYTRPADWLTLPTVLDTDQKIVMLHAVYDHDANFCALECASNYTVNWGDGVVEDFAANVSAYHIFNYANHAGTESTKGYRQAIVTITPQATFDLTKLDLNEKHDQAGLISNYSTGWLDISMAGSFISTLVIGASSNIVRHRSLEQFNFLGINEITSGNYLFNDCTFLSKIVNFYTNGFLSAVRMFNNCYYLKTIPLLNTINVTDMNNMFSYCNTLQTIPLINTANVTDLTSMFVGCTTLKTIPLLDTIKATTTYQMFNGCSTLETIPLLNTPLIRSTAYMFSNCRSLQTIPLFNTIEVTDMNNMFYNCNSLQTIPLLNTINVRYMSSMFYGCSSLQTIPLVNTTNVINMNNMFTTCTILQTVPLLDTSNVTNISNMFYSCSSLQTIPLLDTVKVTTMGYMFTYCNSLKTIPLLNTIAVTDMNNMFASCSSLQTVPLFNTIAVTSMSNMFASCNSLQAVPLFNTIAVTNMINAFSYCHALQTIPAFNANLVTVSSRLNSLFNASYSISKISLTNIRITFSISNLKLSAPAIIEVFNNLETVTGQTLTITGNWGIASLTAADRLIATNKGWTITG